VFFLLKEHINAFKMFFEQMLLTLGI